MTADAAQPSQARRTLDRLLEALVLGRDGLAIAEEAQARTYHVVVVPPEDPPVCVPCETVAAVADAVLPYRGMPGAFAFVFLGTRLQIMEAGDTLHLVDGGGASAPLVREASPGALPFGPDGALGPAVPAAPDRPEAG
jgi:hypothetical protein